MIEHAGFLVLSSLSSASQKVYRRGILKFAEFCNATFNSASTQDYFPVSQSRIILFISYHHSLSYAHATICTYVAAVNFLNELTGHINHNNSFIVQKCLKGLQRQSPTNMPRQPITIEILHNLLATIRKNTSDSYSAALYQAMFSLAFHAFLRVGEFTIRNKDDSNNVLQRHNLKLCSLSTGHSMELTMLNFKGNTSRTPFTLNIPATGAPFCPVEIISHYLSFGGNDPGVLFRHKNGNPISRSDFTALLEYFLDQIGISHTHIKPHSSVSGPLHQLVLQACQTTSFNVWAAGSLVHINVISGYPLS